LFEVANLKFQNTSSSISDNSKRIYALQDEYKNRSCYRFSMGKPNLSLEICQEDYLPEASRFAQLEELDWAFGTMERRIRNIWLLYTLRIFLILL
jgi:hypothetical protein